MIQKKILLIVLLASSYVSFSQLLMGVKSGKIHYQYKNSISEGERVLIFSDSGRITKEYQAEIKDTQYLNKFPNNIRPLSNSNFLRISTIDSLYVIDLDLKTFTAYKQNSELATIMNEHLIKNRVKTGNEILLDRNCEIFKYLDVTYWFWKDIPLKIAVGNNESVETATYIDLEYKIKPDEFSLSSGFLRK